MTESKRNIKVKENKKEFYDPKKIPTDELNRLEQKIIKNEGLQNYKVLNHKIMGHKALIFMKGDFEMRKRQREEEMRK